MAKYRKRIWHAATPEEIHAELRRVAEDLGHTPTAQEWHFGGYSPGPDTINRVCGSYLLAIRDAGVDPPRRSVSAKAQPDPDAVLKDLRDLALHLGRTPGKRDWMAHGKKPCFDYVGKMFGGKWSMAIEAAGLPPTRPGRQPKRGTGRNRQMVTGGMHDAGAIFHRVSNVDVDQIRATKPHDRHS